MKKVANFYKAKSECREYMNTTMLKIIQTKVLSENDILRQIENLFLVPKTFVREELAYLVRENILFYDGMYYNIKEDDVNIEREMKENGESTS